MPTPRQQISTQHGVTGSLNHQTDRNYMVERFMRLPQLNASIDVVTANKNFEILGTNASNDDVTLSPGGGVKIETDTSSADQVIVLPHTDAGQSAWFGTKWSTNDEIHWGCLITTGTSVANTTIWAGLKKTNVSAIADDTNQAFFRYEAATNSGTWGAVSSVGGDDIVQNTGLAVAASTNYKLEIKIDSSQNISFYINGRQYTNSSPQTIAAGLIDQIPYIGIEADSAAATHMFVRREWISQNYTIT